MQIQFLSLGLCSVNVLSFGVCVCVCRFSRFSHKNNTSIWQQEQADC
jgi:hypothetical protein